MTEKNMQKMVRKGYGKIAKSNKSGCGCGCGSITDVSEQVGYSKEELDSVPEGSNLNLGCGNPVAMASIKEGEIVIDLGSGGGLDCFLAANKVGEKGKVIGVDMTPEMLDKARANAKKGKYTNVEFRLGEIENLPVADNSVDVIISNCVINLAPNKKRVFEEAFRVLAPNGRLMVSDIVLLKKLPESIQENVEAYAGCISGAELKDKYLELIQKAGFKEVKVIEEKTYPIEYIISESTLKDAIKMANMTEEEVKQAAKTVVSIKVSAVKAK